MGTETRGFERLLRSPLTGHTLHWTGTAYVSDEGEVFPVKDGIACLLSPDEIGSDQGDRHFYEEFPFGIREWSDPEEVDAGVEDDLKKLLSTLPKDARIADVGCGSGRVSAYLSQSGFRNVASIDYSLNSLRMVRKNTNNYCVWGNNLRLPFAENAFDLVISTGVIHHTPDPERAFSECCRVLRPGGLLYVKLRNLHSPYGYLFYTYGALLRVFEQKPHLKWLSDLLGFRVYKMTRRVFYSHLPHRADRELRGKYENLFLKNLITFFTGPQVRHMLLENGMRVDYSAKTQPTHWQHFYIARRL